MMDHDTDIETPGFIATSTSARQLFLLLRSISYGDKVQMQILEDGVRFSVEDSAVMEGIFCMPLVAFHLLIALGQVWLS
jgi:cell cycle checkpoint protein